jgi:sulfur-oxidizing protein SoxY
MKFRTEGNVQLNQPNLAELMISHPNVSGLAMDQVSRLYAPPRFVRTVQVSYAGKPVMSADVDFTISENPNFRFYFVPRADGDLKAEVVDSSNATFETSFAIRSRAAGS